MSEHEQLPRVKNPYTFYLIATKQDPNVTSEHKTTVKGKEVAYEAAAQAQWEADAEWFVEQGLVRLLSEEEMETILVGLGLLSKISYPTARRELSRKLLELMRERG